MAVSINDFRMAIRIDNSEAKTKFVETKEQITSVRAEMKKLEEDGKQNSDEYKELQTRIDKLNTSFAEQRKEVGRTGLSYTELRKASYSLRKQMDNAIPGTENWQKLRADYLLTKQRMKELEVQSVETRFSLSKVADGFNRYAAIGASAIASLTGVALTARKCVDEYAEMQEAEAQVIKYTGMTKEEVSGLNEEFKQMDTRTARDKLNALAGDAGRLGITGKKDVMEFVDAADKINVALGEDLGEDAVKNIGKLAQMFGEDEKLGLRGAMLATGSAINEVAQNSSAAEAYLVGFTARVAGAANQAKVAQGDILGYASVLDQNMQQQEMAATAFQTLMMKMYQEPAKFAKMAGKSVEEFTTLIKQDANEAILQFLDTLSKKGGLDQLAPIFKEMGLEGVRASGVISTMAGKIDDIRAAQKLANDAYNEGTSILDEFNVQNNTVQAEMDKAKKEFKDVRIELGEKLLPVMKYMVTTGSMTVKGLSEIISLFSEYKNTTILATMAIAGYTIAVNASVIADKANVLWTDKIIKSLKTLYAVAKANPWALLLTIGASLVGLLMDTNKQLSESERLERNLQDVRTRATSAVNQETAMMKDYLKIAKDEKRSKEEREAAIKRLNELSPEYLGSLTLEKINTQQATAAVNAYVDSLLLLEEIKQTQQKVSELNDQRNDLLDNGADHDFLDTVVAKSAYALNAMKTSIGLYTDKWADNVLDNYANKGVRAIRAVDKEIADLNARMSESRQKLIKIEVDTTTGDDKKCSICGNKPCTCSSDPEKAMKAYEESLKRAMQEEQNLWKEALVNKKKTQDEYQKALYDSEIKFLLGKKALLEKYKKDSTEIQGQIYDKMIAEAQRLTDAKKAIDAKEKSASFSTLESSYQQDQQLIKQQYLNGDIKTEKEYQEKMKKLERDYLEQRKQMMIGYGDDVSAINGQILDKQLDKKKTDQDTEDDDKDKKRKSGFEAIDGESDFGMQLNMLQGMRDADLISHEEYEKEKTRIQEDQQAAREEAAQATFEVIGQAAAAASQVIGALQDGEIKKVTRQYDKQIKAAKKAGKDTTKLEEEKEEAINQVKKKYADKQFAAAILQVTASTAVAAMEAYKAMAGIPVIGPALGVVAAAAAVASGAAQIAVAKQQRDEAKGLYSGGFSDDYVQGYTKSGNPNDVAGVIPVHKNEFVTNHEGVANPHVRQFLDIFDVAQKNGTIRMMNTTQILEQVRTRSGKYAGGYSDNSSSPSPSSTGTSSPGMTPEQRSQIIGLLLETNRMLKVLCAKELIVDPRKVRDSIKRVEQLEKNVSR